MSTCTAYRALPRAGLLAALLSAGARGEECDDRMDLLGSCDLGEGHGGQHMGHLYPPPDGGPELWAEWDGSEVAYVWVAMCPKLNVTLPPEDQDACWLPVGHDREHSWENLPLTDTTLPSGLRLV